MSNDLTLDVGLANELKFAMRRNDFSLAELKWLTEGTNLNKIRPIVHSCPEVDADYKVVVGDLKTPEEAIRRMKSKGYRFDLFVVAEEAIHEMKFEQDTREIEVASIYPYHYGYDVYFDEDEFVTDVMREGFVLPPEETCIQFYLQDIELCDNWHFFPRKIPVGKTRYDVYTFSDRPGTERTVFPECSTAEEPDWCETKNREGRWFFEKLPQ